MSEKQPDARRSPSSVKIDFSKSILSMQALFGLTRSESIRIDIRASIIGNKMHVNKSQAHNKKSRWIPIVRGEQIEIIEKRIDLLKSSNTLTDRFTERDLKSLVRCDMLTSGVDPKTHFSAYYAGSRFKQLKTLLSDEKSLETLRLEMGFASKKVVEKLVW